MPVFEWVLASMGGCIGGLRFQFCSKSFNFGDLAGRGGVLFCLPSSPHKWKELRIMTGINFKMLFCAVRLELEASAPHLERNSQHADPSMKYMKYKCVA
jgi:hypothetical protein